MDVVEKKVESQLQFWSLLGPFLVLMSIAILLFKVTIHWYYPVSALIGIPLCVKWKMKGMAISLCILLLLSGIGYQQLEMDDRYWHVGLALAMAFSFIILTLSFEEVQGVVDKLQLESKSRLDNFVLLDEKLKSAEHESAAERDRSRTEIAALNLEMTKALEEKQTFFKLAQLTKEEMVQLRGEHERLLQDLLYKKQQIAQLHERIEETELTIQSLVDADGEKKLLEMSERACRLEKDNEILKSRLAQDQNKNHQLNVKIVEKEQEIEERDHKIKSLDSQLTCLQREVVHNEEQFRILQEDLQNQLKEHLAVINQAYKEQVKDQKELEILRSNNQELQHKIAHIQNEAQDKENQLEEQRSKFEKEQLEDRLALEILRSNNQEMQHKIAHIKNEALDQLEEQRLKFEKEQLEDRLALEILRSNKQELQHQITHIQNEAVDQLEEQRLKFEKEQLEDRLALEILRSNNQELQHKIAHIQNEAVDQLEEQRSKFEKEQLEDRLALEILRSNKQELQLQITHMQKDVLNKAEEQRSKFEKEGAESQISPPQSRYFEAMYLQLKNQFREKCEVLNSTRRELFFVYEKYLVLSKEFEEEHRFNLSENDKLWEENFMNLGIEYENLWKEKEELLQLIDHLNDEAL